MCSSDPEFRGTSLSIDAALEVLQRRPRREVIGYCTDTAAVTVDIDDLADHIVGVREQSGGAVDREAIVTALHHRHLPVLAEHDVIEYDARSGQLRYLPDDRIEEWLDRIRADEPE